VGSVNLITLERLAPDEELLREKLNEALVRELVLSAKGGATGLLLATLLCAMLLRPWDSGVVLGPFLVLIGVTVVRLIGGIWLERGMLQRLPHMRVFRWLAVTYAATGLSLAAIVLASPPQLTLVSMLMLLVIMIGINSTAMVTLAASPFLYAVYLSTPMAAWTVLAFDEPPAGLERVLQIALPIYMAVAVVTMRSVHRSLRNNVVLRLRLAASLGELCDAQSQLVEASRQAGRSDVATAVLHNVGNVLNSVNVSAALINDMIAGLRTAGLAKAASLIAEHRDDLGGFFRDDHRGQKLPDYFAQLQVGLERDKQAALAELQSLIRNIDHIKIIVASQQSHVLPGGVVETFDVHELLDDALKFSAAAREHEAIEIVRDFEALPRVTLDRHKTLQILMNLLANARDAVIAVPAGERRITLRARRSGSADLAIAVEDNGCGFADGELDRMFRLGYTTKAGRHGLGLHYSACAARELHGSLAAHSLGAGGGASFVLVVPLDVAPG
jgi:signal transduction histidine kinase